MRPEASALVAEIFIDRIFRRRRRWKNGDEARLGRIAVIDQPGEVHAVVAAALIHRFRAYKDELAIPQRQCRMQRLAADARERRRDL